MSIMAGDGSIAKFWEDSWCGDTSFKIQFHRLYTLSSLQSALVRYFWSSDGWTFSWRRHIRGGVEALQLENLVGLLLSVVMTSIPDKWTRDFDSSGSFSVKSTRRHIKSFRLPVGSIAKRWNKYVQIKINIFCAVFCCTRFLLGGFGEYKCGGRFFSLSYLS